MAAEPAWLAYARTLIGVREVAGPTNNKQILDWANKLGTKALGMVYGADSVPWCGLFAAHVMQHTGIAPPPIAVRANAWASWGQPVQRQLLMPGSVLVFQRKGGGHVGFYLGEDNFTYSVLGGNQGDAVSIVRIDKGRCIARRWPKDRPMVGGPVRLKPGSSVSTNEA